jgi:hypothetical protein
LQWANGYTAAMGPLPDRTYIVYYVLITPATLADRLDGLCLAGVGCPSKHIPRAQDCIIFMERKHHQQPGYYRLHLTASTPSS